LLNGCVALLFNKINIKSKIDNNIQTITSFPIFPIVAKLCILSWQMRLSHKCAYIYEWCPALFKWFSWCVHTYSTIVVQKEREQTLKVFGFCYCWTCRFSNGLPLGAVWVWVESLQVGSGAGWVQVTHTVLYTNGCFVWLVFKWFGLGANCLFFSCRALALVISQHIKY